MSTSLWIAIAVAVGALVIISTLLLKSRALGKATTAPPRADTRVDNDVQFTVYRPATIVPKKEYTLVAFAHLSKRRADAPQDEPDPVKEVQRLATKILSDQPAQYQPTKLDRGFSVPRQGFLLFVPQIEGCTFNPPTQSIQWLNSVQKVEFGMTADAEVDGRDVEGQMTVYLGTTWLTEVPLRITVDSKYVVAESQQGVTQESSAEPYRKIFASYSHKDTEIVEDFEAYGEALGDDYLRDVRDLRSGEVWTEKLEQLIREASVFQLFWSSNSMTSPFVKQEWEYALGLNREKFIRPVYWEDPLPSSPDLPPPTLSRLQFYKFPTDIEHQHGVIPPVFRKQGGGSGAGQGQGQGGIQTTVGPDVHGLQSALNHPTNVRVSAPASAAPMKGVVAMLAFVALAAAATYTGYRLIWSNPIPTSPCTECSSPTPSATVGAGGLSPSTPTITPTPSASPSPDASPSASPSPSPTSTPIPSPTPIPTPTPPPNDSALSVGIDPAVFKSRINIGTYNMVITNVGSEVIRRVVIRQPLPPEVKYVSSDPPAASLDPPIVFEVKAISVKESVKFRVTVRALRILKPGETFVPQQTIITYLDSQGNQHKYSWPN